MDKQTETNSAVLCGNIGGRPIFSHSCHGKDYYTFPLIVPRLSGTEDVINIIAEKKVLESDEVDELGFFRVSGELRSYNNKSSEGNKLKIFLNAFSAEFCEAPAENEIQLRGTLCKEPRFRVTPLGREICDMLLAVNRSFGHSDYLPCICWGQLAHEASALTIGDKVELRGRVQSREYIKNLEGQRVAKTAYEVSVMEMKKT